MQIKNTTNARKSVALFGFGASAPELFECGDGVYELDAYGKTYQFKAKDTMDAIDKVDSGEYKK